MRGKERTGERKREGERELTKNSEQARQRERESEWARKSARLKEREIKKVAEKRERVRYRNKEKQKE